LLARRFWSCLWADPAQLATAEREFRRYATVPKDLARVEVDDRRRSHDRWIFDRRFDGQGPNRIVV
jgi:hypothetical protein